MVLHLVSMVMSYSLQLMTGQVLRLLFLLTKDAICGFFVVFFLV